MSTVVVINNLPPGCQEQDLRRALMPFGAVYSVAIASAQNQASVRFQSANDASNLVRTRTLMIGNTQAFVDFAGGSYPQQQEQPQQQQQQPYGTAVVAAPTGGYNHVRITVTNVTYPVTQEVIQQVCKTAGTVEAAQVYAPQGGSTVAVVRFADATGAQRAVEILNNQNIYPDCCHMTVELAAVQQPPQPQSQPQPVIVASSYPTPASTAPGPYSSSGAVGYAVAAPAQSPHQYHHQHHHQHEHHLGHHHHHHAQHHQHHQHHHHAMGRGGRGGYGADPYGHHAHHHHAYQQGPPTGFRGRGGIPGVTGRGRGGMRGGPGMGFPYSGGGYDSDMPSIVLISGVPAEVPLMSLFALLEVYGNVLTLRRQYNNAANVIARFQNAIDAKGAAHFLNNSPFFGSTINTKLFGGYVEKHPVQNDPAQGPEDPTVREWDFTHMHHRSSPGAPMNQSRKFAPTENVFITNLKAEITDDLLKAALASKGHSPTDLMRKGPNSAIVSFASAGIAVEMVVACNTFQVEGRYLKLMFSGLSPEQTRHLPAARTGQEGDEQPALEPGMDTAAVAAGAE